MDVRFFFLNCLRLHEAKNPRGKTLLLLVVSIPPTKILCQAATRSSQFRQSYNLCAGEDLNLHAIAGTGPSSQRVCRFHHPRIYNSRFARKKLLRVMTQGAFAPVTYSKFSHVTHPRIYNSRFARKKLMRAVTRGSFDPTRSYIFHFSPTRAYSILLFLILRIPERQEQDTISSACAFPLQLFHEYNITSHA